MLILLITVGLATGFALFATQNTSEVQINLGTHVLNLPFYIAVLIPLLIGLLSSYFVHILYYLSLKLTINEQKDELKKLKEENAELTKEFHKIEIENAQIKSKKGGGIDEDSI